MPESLQPVPEWYRIDDTKHQSVQDGVTQTKRRGAEFRQKYCSQCPYGYDPDTTVVVFEIVEDGDMSGQPHGNYRVRINSPDMPKPAAQCQSLIPS